MLFFTRFLKGLIFCFKYILSLYYLLYTILYTIFFTIFSIFTIEFFEKHSITIVCGALPLILKVIFCICEFARQMLIHHHQ